MIACPLHNRPFYTHFSRNSGMTLVNLLAGLAIAAILAGMVTPAFSNVIQATRKNAVVGGLMAMLYFARDTAVTHGTSVVICPKKISGESCGKDWNQPLWVFIDNNGNNAFDENESRLKEFELTTAEHQQLRWRSFGQKSYLSFDADGTTGYQSGRIYYCDTQSKNDAHKRAQVIVYRTGRSRVAARQEFKGGCQ